MPATVTMPALLVLFKIDRDLHTLQVALDNVQKEQKLQHAKIAKLKHDAEAQDASLKKWQADAGGKDLEMKTRQEHIEKMRSALANTKTDKEYKAILVQISAEKAEVAKIENALLESMQQVETAQKVLEEIKVQIGVEQTVLTKLESEQAEKVGALSIQINAAKIKRDAAAKNVPGDALRQYDRVSQKYPGDALAPLEFDEADLDSISCGSCYMGLNVEHLNALRGRDEIRRCNSCNRILFLPEMQA